MLKKLLEERFKELKEIEEVLDYIVENYENYRIINQDSENIDFETFKEVYSEKKLNIIHIMDLIVNKK
jgi:hypothetical protein